MNFQKVSAGVLSFVAVVSIMSTNVLAAQPKDVVSLGAGLIITPYWTNTSVARANISVSNRVLKPSVYVQAKNSSTEISGTLYLEKKSGSSWQEVKSWEVSDKGILTVSKSYTGTAGTTYRSRAVVSVGGEYVECVSAECTA